MHITYITYLNHFKINLDKGEGIVFNKSLDGYHHLREREKGSECHYTHRDQRKPPEVSPIPSSLCEFQRLIFSGQT